MEKEGRLVQGPILYAGLMIHNGEAQSCWSQRPPSAIPKPSPFMARLDSDLIDIHRGHFWTESSRQSRFKWKTDSAVCVVMALGRVIREIMRRKGIGGLDKASVLKKNVMVFHSGQR